MRGNDAAMRGGHSVMRGNDAAMRVGLSVMRGNDAAMRVGLSVMRGSDAAMRVGPSVVRGNDAAMRGRASFERMNDVFLRTVGKARRRSRCSQSQGSGRPSTSALRQDTAHKFLQVFGTCVHRGPEPRRGDAKSPRSKPPRVTFVIEPVTTFPIGFDRVGLP